VDGTVAMSAVRRSGLNRWNPAGCPSPKMLSPPRKTTRKQPCHARIGRTEVDQLGHFCTARDEPRTPIFP
jgi:hypothetical protein